MRSIRYRLPTGATQGLDAFDLYVFQYLQECAIERGSVYLSVSAHELESDLGVPRTDRGSEKLRQSLYRLEETRFEVCDHQCGSVAIESRPSLVEAFKCEWSDAGERIGGLFYLLKFHSLGVNWPLLRRVVDGDASMCPGEELFGEGYLSSG